MDDYLENAGEKIKAYAGVVFMISAVLAAISGVVTMAAARFSFLGILSGLLVAAVSVGVAYLVALFMSAYGDLVENTAENRKINEEILKALNKQNSADAPATAEAQTWVCGSCKTENSNNHAICKKCGQYRHTSYF